jgi:hypothetical protein
MAAKPVMMTGVLYPLNKKDPPIPCYFSGNAWDPTLEVGGGPMPPQPPVDPGYGVEPPAHPAHPIVEPPSFSPGGGKPPPADGGWGWWPGIGWVWYPGPGGAGPKR